MYLHPINPTNDEMKINPGKTNASIIRPNASRSSYLASSKKKKKEKKEEKNPQMPRHAEGQRKNDLCGAWADRLSSASNWRLGFHRDINRGSICIVNGNRENRKVVVALHPFFDSVQYARPVPNFRGKKEMTY
jgi:hypothetical protein